MNTYLSELYVCDTIAEGVVGFASVEDADIAQYHEQGFLAVHEAFAPDEIAVAKQALLDLIAGRNPEFHCIEFEAAAQEILPTLSPEKREDAVRKLMGFGGYDARLRYLAEHSALLALVARLLEAEPERFQDMALLKPPRLGREKPWHQDHAYFDFPLGMRIVGVWIALDEATQENGCMCVLPGAHRQGPRIHFQRRDWQICDTEMQGQRPVAVPLKPGGCLLFDGLLPHGTPHNHSPHRRRALQFHYKPAGTAPTSREERLRIFGHEGKNVSC